MGISVLQNYAQKGNLTLNLSMRDGTFTDRSPTKSDGTPWVTGCRIQKSENGTSCWFDGLTGILTTGKALSTFITNSEATMLCWAKPVGVAPVDATTYNGQTLISGGDGVTYMGIWRTITGGLDRLWYMNWDGVGNVVGIPYNAGQWICVCGVHRGGNCYIYSNGIFVASVANGNTTNLVQLVRFGQRGAFPYYQGYLDTIVMLNVGLSDTEVAVLTNETKPRD